MTDRRSSAEIAGTTNVEIPLIDINIINFQAECIVMNAPVLNPFSSSVSVLN
jgi:hypothetical protein